MPIIYRATKDVLRSINYGIALGTGDKGFTDMVSDFFGNVLSDAISDGIDLLNSSQEVYWSPYVQIPNLGNVYSLPAIVTSGTTMYSFYQGQDPSTSEGGTGGYLYYSARSFGAVLSDKPCGICYPEPDAPSQTISPPPPVGVMFGGKVYAFYGTNTVGPTGQVYYATYNGTNWSAPQPVPGVGGAVYNWGATQPVTPVVFTPPGSPTPQLFLFQIVQSDVGGPLGITCVSTADGGTWTNIAPDGIGTVTSLDQPYVSAAVYAPPGGTEQIYLFFNSATNFTYVTYPDANGGFSAPTTIASDIFGTYVNDTAIENINGAAVYTPPGATEPLLYAFVTQASAATGTYSDYVAEDDLGSYNATEDTTFSYPLLSVLFTTFDGTTWSAFQQVPSASWSRAATSQLPSVAVLPPASFDGNLSSVADIYLSTVQSAQPFSPGYGLLPGSESFAAFVGSLNQYSAGMAPSQVTAFPAYSTNPWDMTPFTGVGSASLLAVDLPGFTAPQPWLFHGDWTMATNIFQMQYAVYAAGSWTSYPLPTIEVPEVVTPQTIGSPAILPVLTGDPYQPCQNLIVFNTTSGMQGSSSAIAPGCGEDIDVGSIGTVPEATGSPSLAWLNNRASVFYQGAGSQAGQLWCTQWDTTQSWNWGAAAQVPDVALSESPSAIVFNGDVYVFFQGGGDNGQLWYVCQSGTSGTWAAPVQVVPTGEDASSVLLSGTPSACVYTDASGSAQLFVAYAGAGTPGNWPLTYCSLGTDGTWTQAVVPGVLIAESPTADQGSPAAYADQETNAAGRLNVFFQPASSPGQLAYCVYNGSQWSPVATTPVTTLAGWVSGLMYQGSDEALLSLVHNNSGTNAGQITCCQCSLPSTAGGAASGGLLQAAMTRAPAATIANGEIYVFYNSTGSNNVVAGVLAYLQLPLPANGEQISLSTNGSMPVGRNQETLYATSSFIAMANSPAAATFQGLPFVFYNTGTGGIGYCTDPTVNDPKVLDSTSVASDCSPAVAVCNNVLYVFWAASGSNNQGVLQCRYTLDGSTWGEIDLNPGLTVNTEGVIASVCDGLIYLIYSQNGVTYYDIFPQVTVQTAQTVSLGLAPATPISRMACSTGPAVAAFNNGLWCVTQGVEQTNYSPKNGWSVVPSGDLFVSRTLDATNWSWNTAINHAGVANVPPSSTTQPVIATFTPTGSSELIYVFWPDTSGGYIQYVTTDGAYATPSSSAYGLPWSTPHQAGTDFYTNDNLGVVAMPPLDSPSDPEQLYVFWQGTKHDGFLFYATMSPAGEWSSATEIVPVGCTSSSKFMSLSPSPISYAPAGGTPQPYVFYQRAGSSGKIGDSIALEYCVYASGTWTQYEVPNIASTIYSVWGGVTFAPPQTVTGIDAGTPPRAITFNDLLYVFYITKTGGYTEDSSGKPVPYTIYPVSYSTFDGTTWSGIHTIASTAPYQKEQNDIATTYIAQYAYPAVLNDTLYVFFMSAPTGGSSIDPPGVIYYTCTTDGSHWSSPQPTTNVIYVPGGTITLEDNLGTEINDSLDAVNGALSYVGLPTTDEVRNNVAAGVIGIFF